MVRIGIVGLGYTVGISNQHAIAFKLIPEAEITAVYDVIAERGEDFVKRHELGQARVCKSYEELLQEVDAVCICTPNATHIDLAVTALKAGKHVLCEKPFALKGEECQMALNYAQLTQRVGMIGLCYRHIPAFRYMKQLIGEGALGEVFWGRQVMCSDRMADPNVKCEWRMQRALSGTGVIGDLGSHMLDMTEWLLGDQCGGLARFQCMQSTRITEREEIGTGRRKAVTNDDAASFTGQMENGVLISYTVARLGGPGHTFELYGSGGSLVYDGNRQFEVGIRKKAADGGYQDELTFVPVPEELYMTAENTPRIPFTINFFHQAEDFIDCIQNGKQPETDFERGVHIQRLIDTIERAAVSGVTEDVRE